MTKKYDEIFSKNNQENANTFLLIFIILVIIGSLYFFIKKYKEEKGNTIKSNELSARKYRLKNPGPFIL